MFRQASAPRYLIILIYLVFIICFSSQGFLIKDAETALPTVFGKYDNI